MKKIFITVLVLSSTALSAKNYNHKFPASVDKKEIQCHVSSESRSQEITGVITSSTGSYITPLGVFPEEGFSFLISVKNEKRYIAILDSAYEMLLRIGMFDDSRVEFDSFLNNQQLSISCHSKE